MVLGTRMALSGHVCGRGPSEVAAPLVGSGVGVGEGSAVAVGVGMETLTVGVWPAGGEDAPVHAVRSSGSPISIPTRHSCLIVISHSYERSHEPTSLSETNTEKAAYKTTRSDLFLALSYAILLIQARLFCGGGSHP